MEVVASRGHLRAINPVWIFLLASRHLEARFLKLKFAHIHIFQFFKMIKKAPVYLRVATIWLLHEPLKKTLNVIRNFYES